MLKNWFHHLFNPHCSECTAAKENEVVRVLRELLEWERADKLRLLDKLLPREQTAALIEETAPINRWVPPRVRMQQMEAAARIKAAERLREVQVTDEVKKLEEELGVEVEQKATEH